MATTTYGSPYVQSSDLVSAWPTASLSVADRIDDVAMKGNGINAQTGTTYTIVLTDAGKTVTTSNASAVTVTIPTNASVAYETGSVIRFLNIGAGALTIAAAGGVTINNNTGTTAQYGVVSIQKTATDTWYATPFSSGSAKATVTGTTGSPTITTVGSKTCYKFTGSGTITLTAGSFDALICGGGGGGGTLQSPTNGGGGSGGGVLDSTQKGGVFTLSAGTYTVTVGAGGGGEAIGGYSKIDAYFGYGGGRGSTPGYAPTGASGVVVADSLVSCYGQGFINTTTYQGGAGTNSGGTGGSGCAGLYSGGTGGAGKASSITGSSVTYGAGGSVGAGAGTANTGTGGGGGTSGVGSAGGSGVVIILIG